MQEQEAWAGPRYDEGVEDAELDLEVSSLRVGQLFDQATRHLATAESSRNQAAIEYCRGRLDRLKEALEDVRSSR